MSELQNQVRCELYKQLLDEHPSKPITETSSAHYHLSANYHLAMYFIGKGQPEDARFYVIRAGVPKELVVAMDLLVADDY